MSNLSARPTIRTRAAAIALALVCGASVPVLAAGPAEAAACSSTPQSSCTINTTTTVTGGTLGLTAPSNLYWGFVQSGYDQIQSGSPTALSGCTASSGATTCTGGTAPLFGVVDARGGTSGWALTAWVDSTSSALPTGSTLTFNGANAGAAPGTSVSGSATTATTPVSACDKGSTCTVPTAATTCGTGTSRGFTACPVYGTNLTGATSSTNQLDLYSASTSTGLGAICFGSGTATATGCAGLGSAAFFNVMMKSGALAGTYSPVINLSVTSGP